MDIDIIGVPLYYGCDRKGVEKGPDSLRDSGLFEKIKKYNHNVNDLGNVEVNYCSAVDKYKHSKKAKYVNEIVEVANNLAMMVDKSINNKRLPIILGGDHSLSLGSVAGSSSALGKNLGVIWIDAHGDLNNYDTSPSGNVHGMPLAASLGIGDDNLTSIYFNENKVKRQNVFLIGCRDLDEGEIELINDLELNVWSISDIVNKGINRVTEELIDKINLLNGVHLSFDIDSLDPKYIIGTGTPVKNGLTLEDGQFLLESIIKTKKVKAIDFVEFNPEIEYNTTIESCENIIDVIMETLDKI